MWYSTCELNIYVYISYWNCRLAGWAIFSPFPIRIIQLVLVLSRKVHDRGMGCYRHRANTNQSMRISLGNDKLLYHKNPTKMLDTYAKCVYFMYQTISWKTLYSMGMQYENEHKIIWPMSVTIEGKKTWELGIFFTRCNMFWEKNRSLAGLENIMEDFLQ